MVNEKSGKKTMFNVGRAFLNHREVSAQEAAYRILSLELRRSSRTTIYVDTNDPEERFGVLKPVSILENLSPDSEDVVQSGLIDKYINRPISLEQVSLADFAVKYTNPSADQKNDKNKIKLLNKKGYVVPRINEAVLRYNHYSHATQSQKFLHGRIMLFTPWRAELESGLTQEELLDKYNIHKDEIENNMKVHFHPDFFEFEGNLEEMMRASNFKDLVDLTDMTVDDDEGSLSCLHSTSICPF